jgi:hypothetical protein
VRQIYDWLSVENVALGNARRNAYQMSQSLIIYLELLV